MRKVIGLFLLACLALTSGCGAEAGGSCGKDGDCPGGLCLLPGDGFPAGLCSASCEVGACGAAEGCRAVARGGALAAVCLPRCGDSAQCRAGYQCVRGLCQPPCRIDDECGPGARCSAGACASQPGAPAGASCGGDEACASGACSAGACAARCSGDGDCGAAQTCALDRGAGELRTVCAARRGGGAPLEGCSTDDECDRGTCLLGGCLQLCGTPQDCAGGAAERSCTGLPAPLRALSSGDWPELRACLPRNQMFSAVVRPPLLVPRTARSVLLMAYPQDFNLGIAAGFSSLQDPDGEALYQLPTTDAIYISNVIRSLPQPGGSSLLLSSSPTRAPLRYGAYSYQSLGQNQAGAAARHEVRAFYQLADAPLARGRVPLRIHVTDLSGLPAACAYRGMDARQAQGKLATMISRVKQTYEQATVGVTLDPITFVDSDAPNSVASDDPTSVLSTLRAASAQTSGGMDLVLVRAINPSAVLGIAGGIPGAPGVSGSPHTGAVVSMYALCYSQLVRDQEAFAIIVAHELGHTMGLSHNREEDGTSDPLGDGTARSESYRQNQDNLMYWSSDGSGTLLTSEQGAVVRSMPQVRP